MRHGKKFNHLGRTASHRKAMLSNMASSLILHKRISTTVAKAKELRKYVEPLLTRSKNDSTHSRRTVFSYLKNKESLKVLFGEVAEKISARPGGYTRIMRLGNRSGDNAEICIIELVDYNETLLNSAAPAKAKTRRSRRAGGKVGDEKSSKSTDVAEDTKIEAAEASGEEKKKAKKKAEKPSEEAGENEVNSENPE